MSTTLTNFYSDLAMADPGSYYGGPKQAAIMRWFPVERTLSDPYTGDWQGSTSGFTIADPDRLIRAQLASPVDKYWSAPLTIRMTSRANRAILGTPRTVFVGPIVNAQPVRPLAWDITLGDIISLGLLSDQLQLPWRKIRDGFLSQLDEVAESLDVDTPEPQIYGQHLRVPDIDPPSPQGFVYRPTYLGIETVSGSPYHVWLVAGHACADIIDVYIDDGANPLSSVIGDEGTDWLVPHYGGWNAIFTNPYVDKPSDTYGNDRRYTLIYGKVGETNPDNCAAGDGWGGPAGGPAPAANFTLVLAVEGVEAIGDGSGAVITDRFQQEKHWYINYVAQQGLSSYQSGAWLTNPTWTLFDVAVPIVDEDSFDAATAIGIDRLPPDGYIGAAIIGAHAGDADSIRRWSADWNRSGSGRIGASALGQLRKVLLHPTAAIKLAAPLFTDGYEILEGSFQTDVRWGQQANAIPFKADFEHATGQWKTLDVATWDPSIANYGRTITAEAREYPFAPGITMAFHLARLESIIRQDPPRMPSLETTIDPAGLGLLDIGDYLQYRHYAAVGAPGEDRLAQIQSFIVYPGPRRLGALLIDCEDLIDYDAPAT